MKVRTGSLFRIVILLSTVVASGANFTEAKTHFFAGDHLGSSSLILNEAGNITQRSAYFPFGEILTPHPSPSPQRGEGWGEGDIPYLFTGQELDREVDLYDYGARHYDPTTARFMSRDPILLEPPYAYVRNNPILLTDPDGWRPSLDNLIAAYEKATNKYKEARERFQEATENHFSTVAELERRLGSQLTQDIIKKDPRVKAAGLAVRREYDKSEQAGAQAGGKLAELIDAVNSVDASEVNAIRERVAASISDPDARRVFQQFSEEWDDLPFSPLSEEERRLTDPTGSGIIERDIRYLVTGNPIQPIDRSDFIYINPNQEGTLDSGRFIFPTLTPMEQQLLGGALILLGVGGLCAINPPLCGAVILGGALTSG